MHSSIELAKQQGHAMYDLTLPLEILKHGRVSVGGRIVGSYYHAPHCAPRDERNTFESCDGRIAHAREARHLSETMRAAHLRLMADIARR